MVETQQVESENQYEHERVGRVEVQRLELKTPAVTIDTTDDEISVTNPDEMLENGTVYVRFYAYRSGMSESEKLTKFIEQVEPYEPDE